MAAIPASEPEPQGLETPEQTIERLRRRVAALEEVNALASATMASLRLSEARARLVADSIPAVVGYFDADQRCRYANRAWQEWFGAVPLDASAHGLAAVGELSAAVESALRGRSRAVEVDVACMDGQTRRLALTARPNMAPGGVVEGVFLVGFDITERARAEAALRDRNELYSLAMKGPNEGLWDWNPITKELFLSARLLQILGFASDTLRTTSYEWLRLVHPEDRALYEATVTRHLKGETDHFECEYRVADRSGSYRWMLARGLAQRSPEGRANRMVGSIGDITERKRAEIALRDANEELERRVAERTRAAIEAKEHAELANRTKSEFLANMSHELRTPLNAIIGFSSMMEAEMLGALGHPKYREYSGVIGNSAQHLLAVINDILDVAKIEAGRFEIHPQPMDIREAAESSLSLVQERAESGRVDLIARFAADVPPILGDPVRVKQILLNLLSNAVKFTPEGGRVTLAIASGPNGFATAEVTDTGIGMTANDIIVAMQPFGQVDSHLARRAGGTGLGLPLVRSFVEMHHGEMEIESRLGEGTIVKVRLPVADHPSTD